MGVYKRLGCESGSGGREREKEKHNKEAGNEMDKECLDRFDQ